MTPPSPVDPLIIDLKGAGIQLSSLSSSNTYFDFTGSGFATKTAWITSGEGLLILPTSGDETHISYQDIVGASTGSAFTSLQAMDSNQDGTINSLDPEFSKLRVWVDSNGNGALDAGELFTLSQLGIQSLSLEASQSGANVSGSTVVSTSTATLTNGALADIADVDLSTELAETRFQTPSGFTVSSGVPNLPDLNGFGLVPDLYVAASASSSLLSDIQALVGATTTLSFADFQTSFQALLATWAGAQDVDPSSEGPFVNAQHLAVDFAFDGINPSVEPEYHLLPNSHNGPMWEQLYSTIVSGYELRFLSQVALSQVLSGNSSAGSESGWLLPFLTVSYKQADDSVSVNLPAFMGLVIDGAPADATAAASYFQAEVPIISLLENDIYGGNQDAMVSEVLASSLADGATDADIQDLSLAFGWTKIDLGPETGSVSEYTPKDYISVGSGAKVLSNYYTGVIDYTDNSSSLTVTNSGSNTTLVLSGEDAANTFLTIDRGGDAVTLTFKDGVGTIELDNLFGQRWLSDIRFADGSDWSLQYIINLGLVGSVDNTQLFGTAGADTFDGRGYSHYEQGNGGADTFLYNAGYGQLEIKEDAGWEQTTSALLNIGGTLTAADMTASFDGQGDVTLTDGTSGDQVILDGEVALGAAGQNEDGVAVISFSDGTQITQAQLSQLAVTGSPSNTRLIGTSRAELIDPKGYANYAQGGGGADTFVYNAGYGQLEINEDAGWEITSNAVLQMGGGLSASNIGESFDSRGDVTLTDGTSGDQITLDGELALGGNNAYEYGVAAIDFADGTSITKAQLLQASLTGSPTNTSIHGSVYADLIDPKGYARYAQGGGGADTFVYNAGYGQLEINEDAGWEATSNAVLQMGGGLSASNIDESFDPRGDVTLTDGTSGDQITLDSELALGGNNAYEYGVAAIDFADGTSITKAQLLQASLTGSPTNTSLYGSSLADTFDPKGYAHYAQGNGGADTFLYDPGYGQLEINEDAGWEVTSNAVLKMGDGFSPSNISVSADASGDLFVTGGTPGDQIKLDREVITGYASGLEYGVFAIDFADGSSLTEAQLAQMAVTGSATNTSLYGTSGTEVIDAKGFAHFAQGDGGADSYIYNAGYGQLEIDENAGQGAISAAVLVLGSSISAADLTASQDSSGDIVLADGIGGDQIRLDDMASSAQFGVSEIDFSDGTSLSRVQIIALAQANRILGSPSDTHLYGTATADTFDSRGYATYEQGNGGADTFLYNPAYGHLEINEDAGWEVTSNAVLQIGGGLSASNIDESFDSRGDVTLTDGTSGDQITLDGELALGGNNAYEYGVAAIDFADGTSITKAQLLQASLTGSPTNTSIHGSVYADLIDPKGYANYAEGGGGADTFVYNAGYGQLEISEDAGWEVTSNAVLQMGGGLSASNIDESFDSRGDVTLTVGTSGDQITLDGELALGGNNAYEYGVAAIDFADGTSITKAELLQTSLTGSPTNTSIHGSAYADLIDPKGYANYAQGGGGADTFVYNAGYGQLEINEDAGWEITSNAVLQMGGGLSASNIGESFDSRGDVTLTDGTSGDQITLDGELALGGNNAYEYGVAAIDFADGTSITKAQLLQASLTGSPTNTSIHGSVYADLIDPKGYANYAQGGGGADTFVYNAGYGQLEISEDAGWEVTSNAVLQMGGGLSASNIDESFDPRGDVTLTDGTSGDQITLDSELALGGNNAYEYGVAAIDFADGTSITKAQLLQASLTGSPTNTSLYGSSLADTFDPKGYAHYAQGNGGADTFLYDPGYGQLEINEDAGWGQASTSELALKGALTPGDLTVTNNLAGGIDIVDGAAGDRIILDNEYNFDGAGAPEWGVAGIQFSDGETLSRQQLINMAATGSAENTELYGSGGSDTLTFNQCADFAQGYGGNDTYVYDPLDGQVEINNSGGNGPHGLLEIGGDTSSQNVWFNQSGQDLVVSAMGSAGQVRVDGWFSASDNQTQTISVSDGEQIGSSDVEQLVQAMASYSANNPSFMPASATTIPADSSLQSSLAAAWHHP